MLIGDSQRLNRRCVSLLQTEAKQRYLLKGPNGYYTTTATGAIAETETQSNAIAFSDLDVAFRRARTLIQMNHAVDSICTINRFSNFS